MERVTCFLTENPNYKINTFIAIPYNPYEPKPYSRWTMARMLDLKPTSFEIFSGEGAYTSLLDCFKRTGLELRPEIDNYFHNLIKI